MINMWFIALPVLRGPWPRTTTALIGTGRGGEERGGEGKGIKNG